MSLAPYAVAAQEAPFAEETPPDNGFIGKGGIDEADFQDFTGTQPFFQLNGDTKIVTDDFSFGDKEAYILRLTPKKPNADGQIAGSAFLKIPFKGFQEGFPFSTFFRFRVTADNIYDGSGLVFVIQSDRRGVKALGKCPYCMGYDGNFPGFTAIKPSMGVEFDIQDSHDDLDYNMIAFNLHGDLDSVAASYAESKMNNGAPWNVWIDYDGAVIEVRATQSDLRPIDVTVVNRFRGQNDGVSLNLREALTDTRYDGGRRPVYIGFTADPGRYAAYHDILQFRFKPVYSPYGDYNPEADANDPYNPDGAKSGYNNL